MGLVAPRHVGSSRTRARTHVPCIGRQILNHCATREVPPTLFTFYLFDNSHPNWCEVMSRCGFDLISLMIRNIEHLFIHLSQAALGRLPDGILKVFSRSWPYDEF